MATRQVAAGARRLVPVLLQQDAKSLGVAGEIVRVRPGYARNFLAPRRIAVYATSQNLAKFQQQKDSEAAHDAEKRKSVSELTQRLSRIRLQFKRHSNDGATLFGSVTSANIEESLKTRLGLSGASADSLPVTVRLEQPIKALGKYTVNLDVAGQPVSVPVEVVRR